MKSLAATLIVSSLTWAAGAAQIVETFDSRASFTSGSAIWNQALGKIHPTMVVMNYKPGFTPLPFDVGDGAHGAFGPDSASMARFSAGGDVSGNIVRVDTDAYPVLKLTSFHLPLGWRIEPIGANPLVIYSLSDVVVEGDIWCQGRNGGNAVGAVAGAGGVGRCGGLVGGDGGAIGVGGSDGADAFATVLGGVGGDVAGAANAVSGGGGGGWSLVQPTPASDATGVGGLAGFSVTDPEFLNLYGGAGGGGGSGNATNAGAGGGAGGGLVIIHAVRDFNLGSSPTSATGFIYANGGNGGGSNANGGAGGGGGGGAVQVFVGGTINIYNNDAAGASQANNGAGGVNTVVDTGGTGGMGRSWWVSVGYNGIGYYTPAEEAPVVVGNVEFVGTAQTVETAVFDLANNFARMDSLVVSPASADFLVEAAGSSDGFASDDTGWTTNLGVLVRKRYVKLRLTVTASNVNTPDMADTLTLNYSPGARSDFAFKSAGCGRVEGDASGGSGSLLMLLLIGALAGMRVSAPARKFGRGAQ